MSNWWYSDGRNKRKIALEEIVERIEKGELKAETLVWKEGMLAWRPLGEVPDLAPLLDAVPPPLPTRSTPTALAKRPVASLPAGPWARYFARSIDLSWEMLALAFASLYVSQFLPGGLPGLTRFEIPGAVSDVALTMTFIPLALGLDVIIFRLFGNTPGKAILGISVRNADSSRLRGSQYFYRNVGFWVRGILFGVPFISLIALYGQYSNLKTSGSTDYDLESKTVVNARPFAWWRALIATSIGILLLATSSILQYPSHPDDTSTTEASKSSPVFTWKNPATERSVIINERWRFSESRASDGKPIYTFNLADESALVLIATEELSHVEIDRYSRAIRKSLGSYIRFPEDGRVTSRLQLPSWYGEGVLVEDTQSKCTLEVVQADTVFWRIVTIQRAPHEKSTAAVWAIRDALWESVLGKR